MLLTGLAACFEAKAQCNFNISNLSNCDIEVQTIYDTGGGILATAINTVTAGSIIPVNLLPCVGLVQQTVIDLGNGVTVTLGGVGATASYSDCTGLTVAATWQPNDDVIVQ